MISGSKRSDNPVEPTRSENMMVSWRLSGKTVPARARALDRRRVDSETLHPAQTCASGRFRVPHAEQVCPTAAPHSAQKRAEARLLLWHRAQRMLIPAGCLRSYPVAGELAMKLQ